jgi:hypothetical protein
MRAQRDVLLSTKDNTGDERAQLFHILFALPSTGVYKLLYNICAASTIHHPLECKELCHTVNVSLLMVVTITRCFE